MISEFVSYSPDSETGLIWTKAPSNRVKVGAPAGTKHNQGYFSVSIKGKRYLTHHVVWILHNGDIPAGYEIDHRDRNRANPCIENLRLVTRSQNNANQSKQKGRTSPYKGVSAFHKKWQASIKINGKKIHLGTFESEQCAAKAYDAKAKELFGEFAGGLNFG